MPAFLAAIAREQVAAQDAGVPRPRCDGARAFGDHAGDRRIMPQRRAADRPATDRDARGRPQALGLDAQEAAPGLEQAHRRRRRSRSSMCASAGRSGRRSRASSRWKQKSWKGAGGTALLSNPHDATFARRFIGDMAARGEASVALLKLDGKPIAAQVLLYSATASPTPGRRASIPTSRKLSPGTLLVDKISIDLSTAAQIDAIDSCAAATASWRRLWSGRKPMVDMVMSATPRQSPSDSSRFRATSAAREGLKALRDRLRRTPTPRRPPRRAATPRRAAGFGRRSAARSFRAKVQSRSCCLIARLTRRGVRIAAPAAPPA